MPRRPHNRSRRYVRLPKEQRRLVSALIVGVLILLVNSLPLLSSGPAGVYLDAGQEAPLFSSQSVLAHALACFLPRPGRAGPEREQHE